MAAKPNIRFVWQYDGAPLEDKVPKNIHIERWLPLQDLLGMRRVKKRRKFEQNNELDFRP